LSASSEKYLSHPRAWLNASGVPHAIDSRGVEHGQFIASRLSWAVLGGPARAWDRSPVLCPYPTLCFTDAPRCGILLSACRGLLEMVGGPPGGSRELMVSISCVQYRP